MKETDPTKTVRRAALNLLARRDHSQVELVQKLKLKGHPLPEIKEVIARLASERLINEQRYTENYIYSRRNKGYGPERIALELQQKGITEETIAEHLQITDNAWFINARKVWQKHFKGQKPENYSDKAKQMRFLQYRGFTREQIDQAIPGPTYDD